MRPGHGPTRGSLPCIPGSMPPPERAFLAPLVYLDPPAVRGRIGSN
jgi:hypothetical protein